MSSMKRCIDIRVCFSWLTSQRVSRSHRVTGHLQSATLNPKELMARRRSSKGGKFGLGIDGRQNGFVSKLVHLPVC
jgi:hypothetical protein